MIAAIRNPASFRDPSGFVYSRDGVVYRQVSQSYAADYSLLMSSGLYQKLVNRGWLISHEERDLGLACTESAHQVLLPAQLAFVSHPYEWCFQQWKDAALTTLRILKLALEHGMILKDASAYNVQMHEARTTLIDSLSFETYVPGRSWAAYRQFCRHFLAPLALMSYVDVRLGQLLRTNVDGIPLDLATRLLPKRTLFSLGLGLHLHVHSRMEHHYSGRSLSAAVSARQLSLRSLQMIIENLVSTVEGLTLRASRTEWEHYYRENNNYGELGLAAKAEVLRQLLQSRSVETLWDLGANDGRFSRIAQECGAKTVVAWDGDPNCVEANYHSVVTQRNKGHFPLLLDLTNPSPAMGWAHQERASLIERGPADVVLALGLVHHLGLVHGVPLSHIASLLRGLGRRLIIEWVPKQDNQVQKLLATRPDIFPGYTESAFAAAFAQEFQIICKAPVDGTCRTLYLMQALPGCCPGGTNGIRGWQLTRS